MKYCPLSVATLALLWFSAAHAQTENTSTWSAHNRYVALNLGQQQQNYREIDTQGITTNGTLNAETGRQQHLGAALSWQTDNGWLLGFDAQRQTGATAYNGYLQAGNCNLSPTRPAPATLPPSTAPTSAMHLTPKLRRASCRQFST